MRETRLTISEDQATRLRAMMEAMEGRRSVAPAPAPKPQPPASPGAPPRRARTARVVTIASGKGGVGKTTTAVNLAIALAQLNRRTTLLDADLGMANADVLCGLTPTRRLEQFVGVADSAAGGSAPGAPCSIADLAIECPGGFRLIPGSVGIARMTELSPQERERLSSALVELDQTSDIVIVDTGAGLGREVVSFSNAADLAIVVATPEPTSVADAYALIKCILRAGTSKARGLRPGGPAGEHIPGVSLVMNQVSSRREAEAVHARIAAVCQRFLGYRLPLLGSVVQDARVGASVRKRRPLLLEASPSPAAGDLRLLAACLAQELRIDVHAPGAPRRPGLSGLFSRILRGS